MASAAIVKFFMSVSLPPEARAMRKIGDGMSEEFDFSSYLDDEIARNERILKSARRAANIAGPEGFDSAEVVGLIERHLEELKRLKAQQGRRRR